MAFLQQVIGHVRDYWKAIGVPLGYLASLSGDSLSDSSHRDLGAILFCGGLILMACGMPTVRRFMEDEPLRRGSENVVLLGVFLFAVATTPIYTAIKAVWGAGQPDDYRGSVASLFLIYILLPWAARWVEPKGFPFQRLPSRIRRATVFRTVANGAGIFAIAAFLNARFFAYPGPLISTVLTLMVAMAAVTHKTYARARKLCTQVHIDVQSLLRAMDDLDDAKRRDEVARRRLIHCWPRPHMNRETDDKRATARDIWAALKLDFCTTIDSGYRFSGMPFLADGAVVDLEDRVLAAIDTAAPDGAGQVRDDLHAILGACATRIDVLA
ncbi:hypothetical protein ACFWMG_22130 [Streptomyces sp. NPDC127074]|uniref:hypothetical protein n=1 Tax=Streptomyces sp. NPDC127074 TaxID=3347130 RepID=UPI00365A6E49